MPSRQNQTVEIRPATPDDAIRELLTLSWAQICPVSTGDSAGGCAREGEYAVIGVFVAATLPQHGDDFDYHNRVAFQVIEEKEDYLARVARRSLITTGVGRAAHPFHLPLRLCRGAAGGGGPAAAGGGIPRRLRQPPGGPRGQPGDARHLAAAVRITAMPAASAAGVFASPQGSI